MGAKILCEYSSEFQAGEAEQERRGQMLVEVLQLKKKRNNGRYSTIWGDKTALGLFRTVQRIINEGA